MVKGIAVGFELSEHETLPFINKVFTNGKGWSDIEYANQRREANHEKYELITINFAQYFSHKFILPMPIAYCLIRRFLL